MLCSPADSGDQPLISPSEVAILESMLEGGFRLSLKAHFLASLPPLSPLSLTLTCLNLSFNGLRVSLIVNLFLQGIYHSFIPYHSTNRYKTSEQDPLSTLL